MEKHLLNKRFVKCLLCDAPERCKGYCNKHYMRLKNHGDPNYVCGIVHENVTGLCLECKEKLPLSKGKPRKFCCRECAHNYQERTKRHMRLPPVFCKWCGKQIPIRRGPRGFCSRSCWDRNRYRRDRYVQRFCPGCGEPIPFPSHRKWCSQTCFCSDQRRKQMELHGQNGTGKMKKWLKTTDENYKRKKTETEILTAALKMAEISDDHSLGNHSDVTVLKLRVNGNKGKT